VTTIRAGDSANADTVTVEASALRGHFILRVKTPHGEEGATLSWREAQLLIEAMRAEMGTPATNHGPNGDGVAWQVP
jgi:hypothetical protein